MKKTITIVTPAYNEEDCVVELADRLKKVFLTEPNYDFEVIVVENGSEDRTYELLTSIREKASTTFLSISLKSLTPETMLPPLSRLAKK